MEKQDIAAMEKNEHYLSSASRRLITAVVCLSLALMAITVVLVGGGIYMNSMQKQLSQMSNTSEAVKSGKVHFSGDSDETDMVEMYENQHLVIINQPSGGFSAHDYKKSLKFLKTSASEDCFLVPGELKSFPKALAKMFGQDVSVRANTSYDYHLLETPIEDTAFIPAQVREKCFGRFYWLLEVDHSTGGGHDISKRRTCTYCYEYLFPERIQFRYNFCEPDDDDWNNDGVIGCWVYTFRICKTTYTHGHYDG